MSTTIVQSPLRTRDAPLSGQRVAPALTRVLHVINGEDYAGAERVQDVLALQLRRHGFEVGFACIKPGRFAAMRQAREAPLFEVRMRSRFDLLAVWKLSRLIRRSGYALVHTHTPRAALVGCPAAALAGVPVVHHMHSQTSCEIGQRWLTLMNAAVERISVYRAHSLIPVSASLERHMLGKGYPRAKFRLVPNGVATRGELRPLREKPAAWTVGALALFRPRKGLEVLLDALARLRAQGAPVRLRAVGRFQSAEYEQQIARRTAELGLQDAVDWIGFRQDVLHELSQMDLFVLPSLISEAMPMSILEAMSIGVPVIGTRVDGITDLIRDGENGALVEPGDAEDLARTIAALISCAATRSRLRTAAQRSQREMYSDESMAAGVADVYREVLAQ